jgi:hypothetical protein
MVRMENRSAEGVTYRVFGASRVGAALFEANPRTQVKTTPGKTPSGMRFVDVAVSSEGPGVHGFRLDIDMDGTKTTFRDALISANWNVKVWPWKIDPLKDLEGWRKEAAGEGVYHATTGALQFKYGFGGPKDWNISDEVTKSTRFTGDKFGMIAETKVPLAKGTWRIKTLSDDGVRVFIDDKMLFERWDIHGPTPDAKTFTVDTDREVNIRIEHFENDGYAMLTVDLEPAE